jgi:prepilin-type N-terminal cleavage/methylation domain-containing protein
MTVRNKKGFTLVELLIVIAILGTLAVVVLIALNPVQQLARTRDSGRTSTVTQLGHAMEAYGTTRNGVFPALSGTWIATYLVTSGEITVVPSAISYSAGGAICQGTTAVQNNVCYKVGGTNNTQFVIYSTAEALTNSSLCTTTGQSAFFTYSSAAGRGGIVCAGTTTGPAVGVTTFIN